MTQTLFDIAVRTVECARCGAPFAASMAGGETTCRYCGSTNTVSGRTALSTRRAATSSLAEEVARRSRLKAQLEHPIAGNPYDLAQPPPGWSGRDASSLERLRSAWKGEKAGAASTPGRQRHLLWVAVRLAEAEQRAGHGLAARAVLETALDLLADEGHRHMILCRMVAAAVRERDLVSAEAWLAECDGASEVAELDGAHREAQARLLAAKHDGGAMLAVLGARAEEIPVAPSFALPLSLLRAHGHELSGDDGAAYREVVDACKAHEDATVIAALAQEGLAPRALASKRRADLAALAGKRDALPLGLRALTGALFSMPIFAFALLVAVTLPRCFFDADPFLGSHGYVLCPAACHGCDGPFRIYTEWEHNGGEHSTNGPQYFCRTKTNRVATMTDQEMESSLHLLAPYELSWAPAAATYLSLLVLLFPAAVVVAVRRHGRALLDRDRLEVELAELAAASGLDPPPRSPASAGPALRVALMALGGAVAVPLLIILVELGTR